MTQTKDLINKMANFFNSEEYYEKDEDARMEITPDDVRCIYGIIKAKPKTGHWINVNEGKWNTIPIYKCSECGANADLQDWSGESPFCPWCGTKMVEPQESEESE